MTPVDGRSQDTTGPRGGSPGCSLVRTGHGGRGFTLVESMVAFVIFMGIAGMVAVSVHWSKRTVTGGVDRLDQLGQLRMASLRLSAALGYGTQIIYPPVSASGSYHQIIFRSQLNELVALYVSKDGKLTLLTYGAPPRIEELVRRTIKLEVTRPSDGLVRYAVAILDDDDREQSLGSAMWIRNRE